MGSQFKFAVVTTLIAVCCCCLSSVIGIASVGPSHIEHKDMRNGMILHNTTQSGNCRQTFLEVCRVHTPRCRGYVVGAQG